MDTTSSSPAKQPQEAQVMAFASRSELGRYASSLQLMRIPLCDLEVGCVLTDTYAGGRVRGTYSGQLTQGSLAFLLQDDSRSSGYVQCVVSGDLTRLLPRSAELSSGELFVTGAGARVGPSAPECSQESEVEIAVEGDDGKIWIVNRNATNPDFLPSRHPSEFRGRRGNARKEKRRQHLQAGLQSGRNVPQIRGGGQTSRETLVDEPTTSTSAALHGPSGPHTPHTSPAPSHTGTDYASGPTPQPSRTQVEDSTSVAPGSPSQPSIEPQPSEPAVETAREEKEKEEEVSSSSDETCSEDKPQETLQGTREKEKGVQAHLSHFQSSTRQGERYTYKKLSELEPGMQKVNMIGVVTDFKPAFQTKGQDFCAILNITDESLPEFQSFKCTFFHSNQERLPRVRNVGDIVILHRINIKLFPAGAQGIGQSFSSSLSFSGVLGSKVRPVTGAISYTFTEQDRKQVKRLRLWKARQSKTVSSFQRELKDISTDITSSDVICQVLCVSLQEPTLEPCIAILHVWDGTQTTHRRLALDLSAYNTTQIAEPLILEAFSESIVVYGRDLVESVTSLKPGQFLSLQNVQAKLHARQYNSFKDEFSAVELRLQPSHITSRDRKSQITVLSSDRIEVYELKKRLKKIRANSRIYVRPLPPDMVPSGLTETHCSQHQKPVPISVVLKSEDTPAKFLCVVKVLGIQPLSVEGMVKLRCPVCKSKTTVQPDSTDHAVCTNCPGKKKKKKKASTLEPMYFFRLKLADETGHLYAYVSGAQAAKFLSGLPPVVLYQHPQQRMALLERLYTLTGNNDPFDCDSISFCRPWVAVCLVSISTSAESVFLGGSPDVTYHLFDTELKPIT